MTEDVVKVCQKCGKYFKPMESIHIVTKEHAAKFRGIKAGVYHKQCCPLHTTWKVYQSKLASGELS